MDRYHKICYVINKFINNNYLRKISEIYLNIINRHMICLKT